MSTRYLPLFVYGTLKLGSRGFGSSLKAAVTEFAPAYLREASLYIGASYPMAIRSIGGTGIVGQVLLIEQRLFEETLEELDEYEGYLGEGDPNNMYTRQRQHLGRPHPRSAGLCLYGYRGLLPRSSR